MPDLGEVGSTWAAKGEIRPPRLRVVLAVLPGHEGGIVFYREDDLDRWTTASAWRRWVTEAHAAPVVPEPDDDPLGDPL